MCGLAGFAGAGGRGDLEAMTRLVAHRGPDGEGFFLDREMPVFLGHRRLAIIDVADGAQPMASPDGKIVVVYNGEIYNYRKLRRNLENVGTEKWFAAGQDEDGFGKRCQCADKQQCFLGGKVVFHELLTHVEAAAMNAFQVATRRRLPEKEPELTVVINCRDHGHRMV